jgi:allantoin racemase
MRIANILPGGSLAQEAAWSPPGSVMSPGVSVEIVESRFFLQPFHRLDQLLCDVAMAEAGIRAVDAGYDALVLNSITDYGVDALRSAVSVPVVGAGTAAFSTASVLGETVSIVTIWPPKTRAMYDAVVRRNHFEDRLRSIRFVSTDQELATLEEDESFYAEMRSGAQIMRERIGREIRAAAEEDGADVVILGCTCMNPVAQQLAEQSPVPVVNPLVAAHKVAEQLVATGLTHSAARYARGPAETLAFITALLDAGADMAQNAFAEACEACVVVQAS